jgi:DHA3 family macrolide efflux protein-like MFS transporter
MAQATEDTTTPLKRRLTGMRLFALIWPAQFFSLLGTYMGQFALSIWAWQITGKATTLALVTLFSFAPSILMQPISGVLVDRWNRKLVMMISDIASAIITIAVLVLYTSGHLEIWHLFVTGAFTGVFQSFQWPAYSATVSVIVNKENYARASGMLSLADSVSSIWAPMSAGILIGIIGVGGILSMNVVIFLIAISILLLVPIPKLNRKEEKSSSFLKDTLFGFRFISQRRGLLGLQLIFFASNLVTGLAFTVLSPMILSRTGNDAVILGSVQSAFGVGGVVGGLLMGVWGGPKRRVDGVLLGMTGSCILGMTLLGVSRTPIMWMIAAFLTMLLMPVTNGSNQAIWQSKVPPEVQGRVFSTRALIAQISSPIAMAVAGPLADLYLTPAMMPEGSLANSFGWLVGTGPGAGIGLLFVFLGFIGAIIALTGYAFKIIRDVEKTIADHDAAEVKTSNGS